MQSLLDQTLTFFGEKNIYLAVVGRALTGKLLCWSLLHNRVASWRPAVLLKRRLQHRFCPENFSKLSRIPITTVMMMILMKIHCFMKYLTDRCTLRFNFRWWYCQRFSSQTFNLPRVGFEPAQILNPNSITTGPRPHYVRSELYINQLTGLSIFILPLRNAVLF